MAGLHTSLRPQPPSSAANHHSFTAKLLLLLTLLPLSLAIFAFLLQWRGGGVDDPISRWSPDESHKFPGMDSSPLATVGHSSSHSSDCSTLLGHSTAASFPYFRDWKFKFDADLKPKVLSFSLFLFLFFLFWGFSAHKEVIKLRLINCKNSVADTGGWICITTSTSASLEQILPWMFYHKVIGVSTFFLFVEGKAASPAVSKVLESIPGVKVIYRTKELEEQQAKRTAEFSFHVLAVEISLLQAFCIAASAESGMKPGCQEAGMDWILHLDTDELMHPAGAREYSLRQLLLDVPPNVDMVVFPNYESSVERDDIKEPFTEVSMFKKNYDHLTKDTYFGMYKESTRGNPNYFLTYGNGKSAARVQDHLRPNGAHRWHNYMKTPNEIKLEEAAVLHYTYAKFSDLTSRRDRCGCKPTKEDVKRCFMLEFDRAAFIIASTATEEEMLNWYHERVVWTDKTLNLKLLRKGILTRIYAPMTIIQGLRESGIFASIIASGQGSLSKDNFLASIESSNSSRTTSSVSLKSRKMGRSRESQSTARKILEINTSYVYHEVAVPPLSPPVMDGNLMIEE
ncbi:hypothetical protein DH2020_025857 [Rehmannia glutinosa]|uniref:Glycosyltransferase family 92 protein n=1 Tax=Rehmannia glutinosa TaxID=99300 RepID=A0ABR0W2T9_REHGL